MPTAIICHKCLEWQIVKQNIKLRARPDQTRPALSEQMKSHANQIAIIKIKIIKLYGDFYGGI